MTDRPSPEQQLAEVIHRAGHWSCGDGCSFPDCCYISGDEEKQAAAIVAAVNTGDIDPIVPEGKVVVDAEELGHFARLALGGNRRDVEMYVHRLAYRHRHDALGPALAAVDVVPPVSLREDDDCPGCRRDIVDIDDLKGVYAPHRLGCPWLVDTTEPRESYTRAEVIAILEGNMTETTDD